MQTRKSFIALSAAENVMWSQRQGLTDKVSITTAKVGWVHQAASDKLNEMEKRWSAKPSNAAETPPPLPHQAYYSQSLCRFVFFTELSLVTNVTDEQKVHKFTLLLVFTSFGTRERAVRRKSDTLCLLHSQTLCCRYKRDGFIFMFRIEKQTKSCWKILKDTQKRIKWILAVLPDDDSAMQMLFLCLWSQEHHHTHTHTDQLSLSEVANSSVTGELKHLWTKQRKSCAGCPLTCAMNQSLTDFGAVVSQWLWIKRAVVTESKLAIFTSASHLLNQLLNLIA